MRVHVSSQTSDPPSAPARPSIRLVLVDRDSLARRAMREGITATGEFVVAAEAADEIDAIALVRSERPDLVLIDIGYPHLGGIAVAKAPGDTRRRLAGAHWQRACDVAGRVRGYRAPRRVGVWAC